MKININFNKISKQQIQFKKRFYELMFELDLYNKFKKTYFLKILNETNYGYYAHLYLVPGLSFNSLKDKRKIIEENLQCLWIMETKQFKDYATVQIVTKSIDLDFEYTNPHIKPWEMYLGVSFSKKIIKVDCNKYCMFLFSGATGSGKTRFLYMVLLSWILGCSPNDVWLFISDIAKDEYVNFMDIKHVKCYASEVNELYIMMQQINSEFEKRKKTISKYRKMGKATNIAEYNKLNKTNKMPYCYVLIDEFSSIIPNKTDNKTEKSQKEYILDVVKNLEKKGRSLGIFCIIATQKTTRDELPSIIKNMSAVRLSFRANDAISSEVIMGDNSATGLGDRIAVYSLNGGSTQDYLFSPKLTTTMLNKFLSKHKQIKSPNKASNKKESLKVIPIPKGMTYKEFLYQKQQKRLPQSLYSEEGYNDY